MADSIFPGQDLIDSRDVIARIEELESDRECLVEDLDTFREDLEDDPDNEDLLADLEVAERDLEEWDAEFLQELEDLRGLQEEASGYASDWRYGETLIHSEYFQEYAEQLAEDLGYIDRDVRWPYTCIDWELAAEELKVDYTVVSFGSEEYYVR